MKSVVSFVQCRLPHATQVLSPPALTFSSSSRCVGISLLLRFPCGFNPWALLATCPSGILSVWPIQPHAHCFIISSISRCLVCSQSSTLRILLDHQIRRMLLRLLLMNTCNFCFSPLVSLQVYKPYKSKAYTFDPKILTWPWLLAP